MHKILFGLLFSPVSLAQAAPDLVFSNEPGRNPIGLRIVKQYDYSRIYKGKVDPESANAFDSLAEAYQQANDKPLAIKNYQRSLELDPTNTNAIDRLKTLHAGATTPAAG